MKKNIFIISLLLTCAFSFSQTGSNYLMKIDGKEISSEEFLRVYNKNNNITPETEKKSIDEYLDLFINYKLKVIEAENLGYDTVKSFIDEFSGYRDQLAKPYLQNEEIKESLIKEAYERYKAEVRASHILIRCPDNASPEDTLKAYEKAKEIRARIVGGEPFNEVAKATSDDPSVKENSGDLGYFSAFRMVYPFETGAYSTPVGKVSQPVRTRFGYHIIKVTDKRPSKGAVKVAHTMTRIPKGASAPEKKAAKEKIDSAYKALMEGKKWEEVVQHFSENPRTKENNGEIGWLQSGQAPLNFLDACYALDINGFSKPVETEGGYHIAYLLEKKPIETYEEAHEKLARKIDQDNKRKETIKELMNSKLGNKYGMKTNRQNANELLPLLDSSIYNREWKPDVASGKNKVVVSFNDKKYTQYDFAKYIHEGKYTSRTNSFQDIISRSFTGFAEDMLVSYAMKMLPKENPEYKFLLQEYHDGILLFNLTNELVWQKAQVDSSGLEVFYKTTEKYLWNDRIRVNIYEYENNSFTAKLPKLAKKHTKKKLGNDFLTKALCPDDSIACIKSNSKTYEKDQDAITAKFKWEKGSYTTMNEDNMNYFYYVVEVLPAQPKKLDEAKGLYIADYQNHLEKQWINSLREKYSIDINSTELEKIKSELN